MKAVRVTIYAILVLVLMLVVLGIASLVGRKVGFVGGVVWGAFWQVLGILGAVVIILFGGAFSLLSFWRKSRLTPHA